MWYSKITTNLFPIAGAIGQTDNACMCSWKRFIDYYDELCEEIVSESHSYNSHYHMHTSDIQFRNVV